MLTPRPVTPISILAAELSEICAELDGVAGLAPQLTGRLRRVQALAAGLDPYLERCSSAESPDLRRLAERTTAEHWEQHRARGGTAATLEQEMLSGHVEGQLLQLLVHATRATRVLEIGMFTGYSALAMAEALPQHGKLVACELDPDVAEFARQCLADSAAGHKILIRVGPASMTLRELAAAGEQFDLVFIDADKAGYSGYLDALLVGGLLTPHALVCVDNTLLQGQPYLDEAHLPHGRSSNGEAIAAFNAAVAADPRVVHVLLPLRDGLTLLRQA